MPDLLLELFSEEIPARMQRRAAGDLRKLVTDALVEAGLTYEGAAAYWTPRRLTLDLRGLSARSPDSREERKGPRTDAPQRAIDGFLRSAGLASIEDATVRSDSKKGDFYVVETVKSGRPASTIVAEIMPTIIREFPWPKSMRWGAGSREPGSLRWVRPLQSILCVLGPETEETEIVAFEVDGIASGRTTYGHRFMAPDAIEVRRFEDYVEKLESAKVVLDAERRKAQIADDARNLAFARGRELIEDDGLLEEVANLVEWPVVLASSFDEAFLEIPDEVVRLTIRANQKCFVTQRGGALTDTFILVSNIEASDGGETISDGNAKVVRARLADALYFWRTDQAALPDVHDLSASISRFGLDPRRPLDQRMARLDDLRVVFHQKLGTQGDRIERVRRLARDLAPRVDADPVLARRAAALAKADLTTEVVGEFPELQGHMGRRYAELQSEPAPVAEAIEMHYRPQGPNDAVPSEPVSVALALADKVDTLTGFWSIDEKPTGSKDPFALRRAALGVLRIVIENGLDLPLRHALAHIARHGGEADAPAMPERGEWLGDLRGRDRQITADLLAFLHDRLKVYLRDRGARHDLIDAVIRPDSDDVRDIVRRVEALGRFLDTDDGTNLLIGYRRAANILAAEAKKGWEGDRRVYPKLFEQDEERALAESLNAAEARSSEALGRSNFEEAMAALAELRAPLDRFFEAVLVNSEKRAARGNRLALLAQVRDAIERVADFSSIQH